MVCKECGLELEVTDEYCTRCGSLVAEVEQENTVEKIDESNNIDKENTDKKDKKARDLFYSQEKDIVTFKDFVITYLKFLIPVYGLILLVKVLIGSKYIKKTITNSTRATVVVFIIFFIIIKVITFLMGMSLGTILFLL